MAEFFSRISASSNGSNLVTSGATSKRQARIGEGFKTIERTKISNRNLEFANVRGLDETFGVDKIQSGRLQEQAGFLFRGLKSGQVSQSFVDTKNQAERFFVRTGDFVIQVDRDLNKAFGEGDTARFVGVDVGSKGIARVKTGRDGAFAIRETTSQPSAFQQERASAGRGRGDPGPRAQDDGGGETGQPTVREQNLGNIGNVDAQRLIEDLGISARVPSAPRREAASQAAARPGAEIPAEKQPAVGPAKAQLRIQQGGAQGISFGQGDKPKTGIKKRVKGGAIPGL